MASSAPPPSHSHSRSRSHSHSKALPHVKLSSSAAPASASPSPSASVGPMPAVPPRPSADHASPQVSLVFLAEFDINEGSVLKHQYPRPAGLDEHLLAEHMLPDGAHDRGDDWTIFYLNQVPGLTVDPSLMQRSAAPDDPTASSTAARASVGSRKGKGRADDVRDDEGPTKLLYVMSLVRTQMDATVRRGALVKALAVATYNPYIQIYRPLLVFALDDYFKDPSLACLSRLYATINKMDVTGLPSLSLDERIVLRTSERKDMFDDKFPDGDPAPKGGATEVLEAASDHHSTSSGSLSSVASANKSGGREDDSPDDFGPRRSRSRANTVSSPIDEGARGAYPPNLPGQDKVGERASTPVFASGRPKDTHLFETSVVVHGKKMPMQIPLGTFPEEIGDYSLIKLIQTFSSPTALASTGPLHPHLHTNGHSTHPVILLFNALVTHKRIVFLGHGQPAGSVAGHVLAACALGSGCGSVLQGFTERAFPYTNLANLENLEGVPGFIAGVCNPAFADRPSWWDVLCNVETGKIVVSKDIRPASPSPAARIFLPTTLPPFPNDDVGGGGPGAPKIDAKADSSDNVFMEEISNSINSHYGEAVIRARFTDYVQRFVRLAARYEEEATGKTSIGFPCMSYRHGQLGQPGSLGSGIVFPDESSGTKELAVNAPRIEGWRASPSYHLYQETFQERVVNSPLAGIDLAHQLSRLRQARKMSPGEAELILRTLAYQVRSEEQVVALLAHLPPHFGGLLPLAFGLLHPSERARNYTLDLLDAIGLHPIGRKFLASLNAFHKVAYARLAAERAARNARH